MKEKKIVSPPIHFISTLTYFFFSWAFDNSIKKYTRLQEFRPVYHFLALGCDHVRFTTAERPRGKHPGNFVIKSRLS